MGPSFVRRGARWVAAVGMAAAVACGGDEDPTGPNDPGDGGGGGGGGGSGRVVTTAVNVGPGESFSPAHIQVTPGAIVSSWRVPTT
jgi:hypothetical protein